jgi:hypothetical protein
VCATSPTRIHGAGAPDKRPLSKQARIPAATVHARSAAATLKRVARPTVAQGHASTMKHLHLLAIAALCVAPLAAAPFTSTFSPAFHGQPCTEYAAWESFTNADTLPNAPDDPTTTSPDAALLQLTPGAVITTAGNIDHLSQAPAFRISDSVPGDLQEVVLQVSINLNPYNWSTAVLKYLDGGGMPQAVAPTTSSFLVHQMGHDERLITWNSFSTLDAVELDTRYTCAPGTAYCFGDGSGTACPCGNAGGVGNGCASSVAPLGARLSASGAASVGADTLTLLATTVPNGPGLYFQGANTSDFVFGDGKLCTSASIVRLGVAFAAGSTSAWPGTGPIHVAGAVLAGDVRQYQLWYRDSDPTYCTSLFFNLTNGVSVTWTP